MNNYTANEEESLQATFNHSRAPVTGCGWTQQTSVCTWAKSGCGLMSPQKLQKVQVAVRRNARLLGCPSGFEKALEMNSRRGRMAPALNTRSLWKAEVAAMFDSAQQHCPDSTKQFTKTWLSSPQLSSNIDQTKTSSSWGCHRPF